MEPTVIATAAGYAIVEDGVRLHFVNLGGGASASAMFVFGLLAFIALANSVVQMALGRVLFGVVLTLVAVAFGVALQAVRKWTRARRARGPAHLPRLATLDLGTMELLDAAGRPLAALSKVRFQRVFQVGSSSRALAACWDTGRVVVARGTPFAGDVSPLEDCLRARGLRV